MDSNNKNTVFVIESSRNKIMIHWEFFIFVSFILEL